MLTFQNVPLECNQGLSEKTVLSLCEEPKKDIVWIGTDGGGMNLLDAKSQTFRHFPNTWGDKVVSICNYSPDELLISTFAKGFSYSTKKLGKKVTVWYTPLPWIALSDTAEYRLTYTMKQITPFWHLPNH